MMLRPMICRPLMYRVMMLRPVMCRPLMCRVTMLRLVMCSVMTGALQASITEQAKEAYDALVGGTNTSGKDGHAIHTKKEASIRKIWNDSSKSAVCDSFSGDTNPQSPSPPSFPRHLHPTQGDDTYCSGAGAQMSEHISNPLRLLRAGVTVRPKIRGNKHNFSTLDRTPGSGRPMSSYKDAGPIAGLGSHSSFDIGLNQTLPKGFKTGRIVQQHTHYNKHGSKLPLGSLNTSTEEQLSNLSLSRGPSHYVDSSQSVDSGNCSVDANPLPLPPRDRSRMTATSSKPRHQRKHPLIMPVLSNSLLRSLPSAATAGEADTLAASSGRLVIQHTHNPHLGNDQAHAAVLPATLTEDDPVSGSDEIDSGEGLLSMMGLNADSFTLTVGASDEEDCDDINSSKLPPAKPPRLFS